MKKIHLALIFVVFTMLSVNAWSATGQLKPYKGHLKAPQFSLKDINGKTHSLSDYKGNVVLLQFWATYCAPCRKEMPTMNRLIKKMEGKAFKILTVNMAEDEASVKQFLSEVKVDFPVLMDVDGALLSEWKVFAAPANFIIDKKGNILYTLYGGIEWDNEQMVENMKKLSQ
ncbi:MAG: TlpA family protein disulfide reductase [Gammaproteobacteria bacterium]|nr:TlpA family protein disulfide reductase [Gammaproteobacteria bacterium]